MAFNRPDSALSWRTVSEFAGSQYEREPSIVASRPPTPLDNGPREPRRAINDDGIPVPADRTLVKTGGHAYEKKGAYRYPVELPYSLTAQQFDYLRAKFPSCLFKSTSPSGHDHPCAHAETVIGTRQLQRCLKPNSVTLDVYGDPSACEVFNKNQGVRPGHRPGPGYAPKRMVPLVAKFTEKDYLRSIEKWGDEFADDDTPRWIEDKIPHLLESDAGSEFLRQFTAYSFIHTLYYMDREDIAGLLANNKGAMAYALVHRHPQSSGTMFGGECQYSEEHGFVTQVNVKTGENYIHPSIEWLWTSTTKVWRSGNGRDAFTWTFQMVTDDTWVVKFAWCPARMDERFVSRSNHLGDRQAAAEMNEHSVVPHPRLSTKLPQIPGATYHTAGLMTVVSHSSIPIPLRITCPDLVELLRIQFAGKPRDPTRLADMFAVARRETTPGSKFPGQMGYKVAAEDLKHHVALAFFADAKEEADILASLTLFSSEFQSQRSLSHGAGVQTFGTGVSTVRAVASAARVANTVVRSKDGVGALLDTFGA